MHCEPTIGSDDLFSTLVYRQTSALSHDPTGA
jgi:hypothetical protein